MKTRRDPSRTLALSTHPLTPVLARGLAAGLLATLAAATPPARAEVKTLAATARYCKAQGESPTEARRTAFELGKRLIIDEAASTLLWSDLLKGLDVPKADLHACTFFLLEAAPGADKSDPGEKGCIVLEVTGKVDTGAMEKLVKSTRTDRQLLWTVQGLWLRLDALSARLADLAGKIERTGGAAVVADLVAQKKATIDAIGATGYLRDSYAAPRPDATLPGMALSLDPGYAEAYVRRAWVHSTAGDWESVLADSDKALEIDPASPAALVNRAVALRNLGEPERAVETLTKAIDLNGDYALAYHDRGVAHAAAGRHEEALADYQKALDLDPALVAAHVGRCGSVVGLGRATEALAPCQKSVELAPASFEAHLNLGIALGRTGDTREALKEFRRAIEIRDKHPLGYYNRAFVHWGQGNKNAARADWKKACDLGEKLGCRSLETFR